MRKYILLRVLIFGVAVGLVSSLSARNPEYPDRGNSQEQQNNTVNLREDCAQATAQVDQEINNVRARLLNGGDVWWDLNGNGRYIVPKVELGSGQLEVSSIFAGSVWLGGRDDQNNLRMAANTYREANNNDFYPGPLTPDGSTTPQVCENWDRFFKVTSAEIDEHRRNLVEKGDAYTAAEIPDGVKYWPGRGNDYFVEKYGFELPDLRQGLGSFRDYGGFMDMELADGLYDPLQGDYPVLEIHGCELEQYPDEMFFWVYNDAGGPHSSAEGSERIRMEVQVQAFAYATNDEINNMTFQRYKMINRARTTLDSAFFAMWVDPDLGCDGDDYIGCDTSLSMMYVYNSDEVDGDVGGTAQCASGANTYGFEVPILGVDYFRGPIGPKVYREDSTLRNPRLGEPFDVTVELGMSSFTYYNRRGGPGGHPVETTDPQLAHEFYNYISGSWKDGTPFTFGGSGYQSGGREINYAFTGAPDNDNAWSMCSAQLRLGDRRTVQASGPFRLDPGSVNELIIGVVWTPDIQTYPCPDLSPLIRADVKAQALFDACFNIPDGPDAPDLGIIEMDRQVIFTFSNDTVLSNNAFLGYSERGLDVPKGVEDSVYVFEGYKLYQLAGPSVDAKSGALDNIEQARLVAQVDIRNNVTKIYNWEEVEGGNPIDPSDILYTPTLKVDGNNEGIINSIVVENDAFASTNPRLINHKKYYYTVIAYGYNNYDTFNYELNTGQATPYLVGRNNIEEYEVIPRPTPYSELNSSYGEGPEVIRLDGTGSGNNFLRVSKEMREAMLTDTFSGRIVYEERSAPIDVKIYNPFEVENGDYMVEFFDDDLSDDELDPDSSMFRVTNMQTGVTFESEVTLDKTYEQLIPDWGISVFAKNRPAPGDISTDNNGAIGSEINYSDQFADEWFGFWNEEELFNLLKTNTSLMPDYELDPNQAFSQIINGPFYPMTLLDYREPDNDLLITPAWMENDMGTVRNGNDLSNLNNVDIVFTSNKDLWSKCIVVELANKQYTSSLETQGGDGDEANLDIRDVPSRGKDIDPSTGEPVILPDEPTGFSYFPGYAVDVETGERLNIFFGENSVYSEQITQITDFPDSLTNGGDMIWNPNSTEFVQTLRGFPLAAYFGGQHMIYVTDEPYDGCEELRDQLYQDEDERIFLHKANKSRGLEKVQWACFPLLPDGAELNSFEEGLIPSELTISMRVDQPYEVDEGTGTGLNNGYPKYNFTIHGAEQRELTTNVQIDSALDLINVVPNPYYGFSQYETSSFTKHVKITNLPPECTVTIYSLDGKFIRQYKRNEQNVRATKSLAGVPNRRFAPDITWDLLNTKQIPISSGVYLIHVDAPGLGERVIKWFGVNRQFDPTGL